MIQEKLDSCCMKDPLQMMIDDAIKNETLAWFSSHHCKIWAKDRTKGLVTPRPNYLQKKIQAVVNKCHELELPCRITGLKPRARGSTTFFTANGYTGMRRRSMSALFIGGQSDQTVGLWEMMKTYAKHDTFDWGNTGEVNEKGARFSNGSRAKKETARDVQAGIGDTYSLCHCTEVARWGEYGVSNTAAVMTNLLKAIPLLAETYVFLESTAEMAGSDFHVRFNSATLSDDFISDKRTVEFGSYVSIFAAWFQFEESAIRLTNEQKEHVKRSLDSDPEWEGENDLIELYCVTDEDGVKHLGDVVRGYDVWEQLAWRRYSIRNECDRDSNLFDRDYPHSAEVAFQKSGRMRFNATGVGMLRKRLTGRTVMHGLLEESQRKRLAFRNTDINEAQFSIFEKPTPDRRYIVPIDPMTGASQASGLDPDYHGIFALRAGFYDSKGEWIRPATVGRVVPCRWEIDMAAKAAWKLARFFGSVSGCKIVVEMNMDRGFTEHLKALGADLYIREHFNRREQKLTGALGYLTTEKTRETIISTLATAIREWETPGMGIDIWCSNAVTQCENFIDKDGRSEAGQGYHDDDIFSISLGLELIEQATVMPMPLSPFSYLDPHGSPREAQQQQATAYS